MINSEIYEIEMGSFYIKSTVNLKLNRGWKNGSL